METQNKAIIDPVFKNRLQELYLMYVNDFISTYAFADHLNISQAEAELIIEEGRKEHEQRVKELQQSNSKEEINIKSGLFDVTLNKEEVTQLYEDNMFLEDIVQILLNPELLNSWDYKYSSIEEVKRDWEDYLNRTKK